MELLIATHNQGKLFEYRELLPEFTFVHLADVGLGAFDVDETGSTFAENAALKAVQYGRASGRITLSDDSGIAVDALDGAPGLFSARYGGDGLGEAGRRTLLLDNLRHVPPAQRTAQFVCVCAVHDPRDGKTYATEGIIHGHILLAESDGVGGFGYDPLFVPDGYDVSFAQMPTEQKNRLSHRGVALQKLLPTLRALVG